MSQLTLQTHKKGLIETYDSLRVKAHLCIEIFLSQLRIGSAKNYNF